MKLVIHFDLLLALTRAACIAYLCSSRGVPLVEVLVGAALLELVLLGARR